MTSILIPSFRYDHLPPELAKAAREAADRIRARVRTATAAIIQVGGDLIAVKRQLDHGEFTKWVEIECGFGLRTAQNYMRVAAFATGKSETVSLLRPATVYRLAAPGTPPEVVAAVIESLQAGRRLTDNEITVMLDQARRRKNSVSMARPSRPRNEQVRTAELATEIMNGLGPELARELIEDWEAVGKRLRCLVETGDQSVHPRLSAASSLCGTGMTAACTGLRWPPVTPRTTVSAFRRSLTATRTASG
jgi:hypothetical protein